MLEAFVLDVDQADTFFSSQKGMHLIASTSVRPLGEKVSL